MEFQFRRQPFSFAPRPLRLDMTTRVPEVDADDPEACPCCQGASWHRVVTEEVDAYGDQVVRFPRCEDCHGTGIAGG